MIVTITVKNNLPKGKIFYYEPPTTTFQGQIVPNPDYVADDCITLTGDRYCPLRIIPKRDILTGIDLPPPAPYANEDLICNVQGSQPAPYVVSRTNNIWNCTCTGFAFRKDCKHVVQVKNAYLSTGSD